MKFNYICDVTDGLVLIDKEYLKELNDKLLIELDILLDRYGKSELVYDFPNEKWEDVQKRETRWIVEFCNSGKMVIFLHYKNEKDCEINFSDSQNNSQTMIDIRSGKLIVVNASELIQCLAYPKFEIEPFLEIDNIDVGLYAIQFNGINSIKLAKSNIKSDVNNILELL